MTSRNVAMLVVMIVGLSAVLSVLIAPVALAAVDDDIPGVAIPASPFAGSLDESADVDDVFSMYLDAGETLLATLEGDVGTDFDLLLFPPGSTGIYDDAPVDVAFDATYPEVLSYMVPVGQAGTYYLVAESFLGSGSYTCSYTVSVGGDDEIPGIPLPPSPVVGSLDEFGDTDDVYSVELAAGETLRVSLTGAAGTDFDALLYAPVATSVYWDIPLADSFSEEYPDVISYTVPTGQSGTYYLDIVGWWGAGDYTLTYSVGVGVEVVAISGSDRYDTAVRTSMEAFPDGADTVVIATGESWPDALGGASLAAAKNGPILLTRSTGLPSSVLQEVRRLEATQAVVLGGTGAVSAGVESVLVAELGASNVSRIGGADRFSTAELIAQATVDELGPLYDGMAFFSSGADFPDALAASPLAAARGWPLFLAGADGLRASTQSALGTCGVTDALILGGEAVVPSGVEAYLNGRLGPSRVERLSGANRYATAAEVAEYGCQHGGLRWDGVAFATGQNFPDALAGGVLQGMGGSVLLLTPTDYLHESPRGCIEDHVVEIATVKYLGGTSAVSDSVRNAVTEILD